MSNYADERIIRLETVIQGFYTEIAKLNGEVLGLKTQVKTLQETAGQWNQLLPPEPSKEKT